MNSSALLKRSKSPISATSASAVSVSIPAQAAQGCDQPAPRLFLGRLTNRALERLDPRVDKVDRVHVAVERLLLGGELEALLAEPLATRDSPRAGRQRASVPQAEPREPVPVTHPIKTRVLTGAYQIARSLQLTRGNMNRLEQPTGEQTRQLARVPAVGLDPVARPLRHQPRRHHPTIDPPLDEKPLQTKTGRTRLITTAHHGPTTQHQLDGLLVVGQRPLLQKLVSPDRRDANRPRVNVQPNGYRRHRVVHGRRPPYVALPDPLRQPTTDA